MTDYTTPIDELEAVNLLLASIGEAPINSLAGTNTSDVATARRFLAQTSRALQLQGWHFNSDYDYPLNPVSNEITLASNVLKVDADQYKSKYDFCVRGTRLYSKQLKTYTITESITVDIVWNLPFNELTEAARWYITVKAGRKFQEQVLGSDTLDKFSEADETLAWKTFIESEYDTADYSFKDNYTAFQMLDRSPGNTLL